MLEVTALTTEQQLFLSHVNLQSFAHTPFIRIKFLTKEQLYNHLILGRNDQKNSIERSLRPLLIFHPNFLLEFEQF